MSSDGSAVDEFRDVANELRVMSEQLQLRARTLDAKADVLMKRQLEARATSLVRVRIVKSDGALTSKVYTYRHTDVLRPGAVVVVPTVAAWQPNPSYAVVTQNEPSYDQLAPSSRDYRPITRVVGAGSRLGKELAKGGRQA